MIEPSSKFGEWLKMEGALSISSHQPHYFLSKSSPSNPFKLISDKTNKEGNREYDPSPKSSHRHSAAGPGKLTSHQTSYHVVGPASRPKHQCAAITTSLPVAPGVS